MAVSFKEYVEEKYYDYLYSKLKYYIFDNKSNISFRLKNIDTVHYVEVEDAYFKKFYVHNYSKNQVGISIIIEVEATLKEYKCGEYNFDHDYPWFLVKCRCDFTDKISNFKIVSIEHYDGLDKEQFGLTDNLIPYIKKERLDDYAATILQSVYPEALKGSPIDPYEFARRLKLNIKEVLFKDKNKMGTIYFAEHKVKTNKGIIKTIPANTIMVSKKARLFGFEGSNNFTIMHECVHYILHKRAFQLERLFNKKAKSIECYTDGSGVTNANTSAIDWMEWQANNLAPRLMMPADQFKNKVLEYLDNYRLTHETNDYLNYYEKLMHDLANYYGASIESVKIRLIELGFEFPLGCLITVDGKPVMPHTFSKGALAKNETYSISEADAAMYSFTEKYINNNSLIDAYIYVDSHLCINHSKFITKNEFGRIVLTDYARHHMDECCIKFELDIPKKIGHQEMNYNSFKILNRKKGNHSEIVVKAFKLFSVAATNNNQNLIEEAFDKVDDLFSRIPRTSNGLFLILKEYSGYSIQELVDISGLSKETVENYLYKENYNYSQEGVVRMLLAMNIPSKISFIALELCKCGLNIKDTQQQWIDYVLRNRWLYSINENLKFLLDRKIYI